MNSITIPEFQTIILDYFKQHGRSFSWRYAHDPYHIVVSEIMLQQTQTQRVIEKFALFTQRFPTFSSLAHATLQEVLFYWQGLGYNRRGKYLHQVAQKVVNEHGGILPNNPYLLKTFPGIGPATAASICAFAFNTPTVFIETNIRTVFIHFFFAQQTQIKDSQLMPLIEQALYVPDPRSWYYALMDYGVMLKKNLPNPSRKSAHHTRQSKFEGSNRQIRGRIIKELTLSPEGLPFDLLCTRVDKEPSRIIAILEQLLKEEFICNTRELFVIK